MSRGIPKKNDRRRKISVEDELRAVEMRKAGATYVEIAKSIGLIASTHARTIVLKHLDPDRVAEDRARWLCNRRKKDPVKRTKHYIPNAEAGVEYAQTRVEHRAQRLAFILRLKSVPCMDCGRVFPPCAMDFDHRDPAEKSFTVSVNIEIALDVLLAEIEKCDVVCACCHRIRTHAWHVARGAKASIETDLALKALKM